MKKRLSFGKEFYFSWSHVIFSCIVEMSEITYSVFFFHVWYINRAYKRTPMDRRILLQIWTCLIRTISSTYQSSNIVWCQEGLISFLYKFGILNRISAGEINYWRCSGSLRAHVLRDLSKWRICLEILHVYPHTNRISSLTTITSKR